MVGKFLDGENFINYVEEKDNLFRDENNYFSVVWEKCLTSDYWKSWREKIRMLPSKEVGFFMDRILELRSRILWNIRSYRKDRWNDDYTRKLVGISERELENITEKEFYNDKPRNGVKKLTVKEISNMFDMLEKENLTQEQLVSKINRLKTENEQLKNNQTLTTSERQEKLQQNQKELEKVQSLLSSKDIIQQPTTNNFPTSLVVGGVVLTVIGLVLFLVVRKGKKIKKKGA